MEIFDDFFRRKREELKQEYIREIMPQIEKDFDSKYDSVLNEGNVAIVTSKSTKVNNKPKKRTRLMSGFTKSEELVDVVLLILDDGKPKSRSDIVDIILEMHNTNVLHLKTPDLIKHRDGRYRVYKTLDGTRKYLLKTNQIEIMSDGCWRKK